MDWAAAACVGSIRPKARGDVMEIAGYRQRRGREHPRRARALAVLAQRTGYVQRCALQAKTAWRELVPMHVAYGVLHCRMIVVDAGIGLRARARCVRCASPARKPRREIACACMAGVEAGRCLAQRHERLLQPRQRIRDVVERIAHHRLGLCTRQRSARRQPLHRRAQRTRGVLKLLRRVLHDRERATDVLALGRLHRARVPPTAARRGLRRRTAHASSGN